MTQPIGPSHLPSLSLPARPASHDGGASAGEVSFHQLLSGTIQDALSADAAAQSAITESLAGGDVTQVEVFSAVKQAELSLRMMLQIRNKLLEAYDEIKQMQM